MTRGDGASQRLQWRPMAPNGTLRRRQCLKARLKRASSVLETRLNRLPKPHLQRRCLIRASMVPEGPGMVRLQWRLHRASKAGEQRLQKAPELRLDWRLNAVGETP